MSWYENEVAPEGMLDAERIYRALERVATGSYLYESATQKFPDKPPETPGDPYDDEAFLYLVENEFVDVPTDLRNAIDKFRHLQRDGERTRNELSSLYRRLKTLAVQLKKADRDMTSGLGILKSKNQQWEERTRRDALANDLQESTMKRRRMESDLEKAGTLYKELIDRIYADQALRDAYWYQEMPVLVTKYGRFLLEFLGELNPAHFRGRTLAEIIEIGASLA